MQYIHDRDIIHRDLKSSNGMKLTYFHLHVAIYIFRGHIQLCSEESWGGGLGKRTKSQEVEMLHG